MRRAWRFASVVVLLLALDRGRARADADETPETAKLECVQRHEDAQVTRRQGHLLAARAALLACSRADCPDAVRADCVDWLEDVNRSVPSVVITARDRGADVSDVQVFLDGGLVVARLTGGALEADPGEHRFRFVSGRGPVIERTVLMSEGVRNRPIDVEFAPPPVLAAPAPAAPPPPWSFAEHPFKRSDAVFAGVALVGLGTAAALGIWALYERSALAESCGPRCTDAEASPLRVKLVLADVALGVAAVALGVGTYRYLTRPGVRGRAEVRVLGAPGGALGAVLSLGRQF